MTIHAERAIYGGFFGGITGALLGAVIGALIGLGACTRDDESELRNSPDPMSQQIDTLLAPVKAIYDATSVVIGISVGAVLGVAVGGIAGSITGTALGCFIGWHTPLELTLTDSLPSSDEDIDVEITRLQRKITALEKRKMTKGRDPAPD